MVVRRLTAVHEKLSTRETQILRLVAAGLTTKAIAATLSIAQSTVNWHVGNVLAKLGASSRAEAVAIMLRDGGPLQSRDAVVVVHPRRTSVVRRFATIAATLAILFAVAGVTAVAALGPAERDRPDRPAILPSPSATPVATASPRLGGAVPRPSADAPADRSAAPSDAPPATQPPILRSGGPATVSPAVLPPVLLPTPPVQASPLPIPSIPSIPAVVSPAAPLRAPLLQLP